MWIRTIDGGIYIVNTDTNLASCYDENKEVNSYYLMGRRKWKRWNTLKVKKQGETLIDVLEDKDLIMFKDMPLEFYRNKSACWSRITNNNIKQVITHEQYMPLAQEVK